MKFLIAEQERYELMKLLMHLKSTEKISYKIGERRKGDIDATFADNKGFTIPGKVQNMLLGKLESAWNWKNCRKIK